MREIASSVSGGGGRRGRGLARLGEHEAVEGGLELDSFGEPLTVRKDITENLVFLGHPVHSFYLSNVFFLRPRFRFDFILCFAY